MAKTQKPEKRKCEICYGIYTPKQPNQLLCGNPRCRKHYTRLIAFDIYIRSAVSSREYSTCYICGNQYFKTRKNQNTCTRQECRKTHRHTQVTEALGLYRSSHRDIIRKRECEYSKFMTGTMHPRYLAKLVSESVGINLTINDIPVEVLETKAAILKIKREVKNERSSTKEQQGTERLPS